MTRQTTFHPYALRRPSDSGVAPEAWRRGLAGSLRRGSAALLQLAERLARVQTRRRRVPELEFYAEAGAPEGALYVDGQLVGMLPGVTRL